MKKQDEWSTKFCGLNIEENCDSAVRMDLGDIQLDMGDIMGDMTGDSGIGLEDIGLVMKNIKVGRCKRTNKLTIRLHCYKLLQVL